MTIAEPTDSRFDSVVCERCIEKLDSAGQIASCMDYTVGDVTRCEQCGLLLSSDRIYLVVIEP